MKRLLLVLCLLALACGADARMGAVGVGGSSGNAVCSSGTASAIIDYTSYTPTSSQRADINAMQFTITGTQTVTHYQVNLCKYLATGSVDVSIYTDSGSNTVGTIIAGTTVNKLANTLPDCGVGTQYDLVLATPKTGLSGVYWLVVQETGTSPWVSSAVYITSSDGVRKVVHNSAVTTDFRWPWSIQGCSE